MKQYTWPKLGITTSTMIYGCMTIGGGWDDSDLTKEDERRAFTAISGALEAGFTMFDHADIYCHGKSEQVFGSFLAANPDVRDSIQIQSKCGIRVSTSDTPTMYDFSREHVIESVEGSLRRLGIGQLDVLLFHRPDPLVEPDEVAAAMNELNQSGKVKAFGVSNHSALQTELLQAAADLPLVANQLEVGLAHPDLVAAGTAVNQRNPGFPTRSGDALEYARLTGMTVQAWSPLSKGIYSGRGEEKSAPAAERAAAQDAAVQETSELVERLAAEYGVSREAIVVAWVMRHPSPILPVIGTTNPERIRNCAQADSIQLTREHWYQLLEAARGMPMP